MSFSCGNATSSLVLIPNSVHTTVDSLADFVSFVRNSWGFCCNEYWEDQIHIKSIHEHHEGYKIILENIEILDQTINPYARSFRNRGTRQTNQLTDHEKPSGRLRRPEIKSDRSIILNLSFLTEFICRAKYPNVYSQLKGLISRAKWKLSTVQDSTSRGQVEHSEAQIF